MPNGLSTASAAGPDIPTGQTIVSLAAMTPPGPSPQTVMSTNTGGIGVWKFPLDTPMYYMSLGINDYVRASWLDIGTLAISNTIILPFPMKLVDATQVQYERTPLGFPGVIAETLQIDAMNALKGSSTGQTSSAGILPPGVKATAESVLAGISSGVQAATGVAMNEFLTIMLKGPSYKQHEFSWSLSPKDPGEAGVLQTIITLLKDAMAPGLSSDLGAAFFTWPKIFQIQLNYAGPNSDMGFYTFRMKPSVLTDAVFDFTPGNQWAAHYPTFQTNSSPTPFGVDVRLEFMELELWLAGQVGGTFQDPTISSGTPSMTTTPVPGSGAAGESNPF